MNEPLYTTEILRLAVHSAAFPRLGDPQASETARTPICGSTITLDLNLDAHGAIAAVGFDIQACAMGQASAALFGAAAAGHTPTQLAEVADALAAWLEGGSDTAPDWPGIGALAPARTRPARHAAILLPFRTAAKAALAAT